MFSVDLDDQVSYGSLGNDDSVYDIEDDPSGSRSNKARRLIRKKEKGDGVKRPGSYYHSRVIDDMPVGQGSPSMSHVTPSFGEANMTYGSKARLSQARISLIDASSLSSCNSVAGAHDLGTPSTVIKRSVRSASVKEPSQKKKETAEEECLPQNQEDCTLQDNQEASEERDEVPVLEDSGSTSPAQARENQSTPDGKHVEKVFKRTFQERYKPLVSLEDLNVVHRLPVSSAFTYSFYELPNQHREHNNSIKKAAGRIGRRKKKESGHFRSRSAP